MARPDGGRESILYADGTRSASRSAVPTGSFGCWSVVASRPARPARPGPRACPARPPRVAARRRAAVGDRAARSSRRPAPGDALVPWPAATPTTERPSERCSGLAAPDRVRRHCLQTWPIVVVSARPGPRRPGGCPPLARSRRDPQPAAPGAGSRAPARGEAGAWTTATRPGVAGSSWLGSRGSSSPPATNPKRTASPGKTRIAHRSSSNAPLVPWRRFLPVTAEEAATSARAGMVRHAASGSRPATTSAATGPTGPKAVAASPSERTTTVVPPRRTTARHPIVAASSSRPGGNSTVSTVTLTSGLRRIRRGLGRTGNPSPATAIASGEGGSGPSEAA